MNLKKVLLGDRLHVEYDIACDHFRIPVLTVQPLVENAICRGIEAKEGGGTVWLSVREDAQHYIVTVRDDGMGFAVSAQKNGQTVSVSYNNIRERLRYYGNHTLSICSAPNDGTCITVTYEKRLEQNDENHSCG